MEKISDQAISASVALDTGRLQIQVADFVDDPNDETLPAELSGTRKILVALDTSDFGESVTVNGKIISLEEVMLAIESFTPVALAKQAALLAAMASPQIAE